MPVLRSSPRGPLRARLIYRSAVVAGSIAAITALVACGSATGGASAGSGSSAASGGASGTLNWEWELPTSWDPVTSSAGWDMHALGLVSASLPTLDTAGELAPRLA